jgi:hypothetical protein
MEEYDQKTLRDRWMNDLENFSKAWKVIKKWIWEIFYVVRMIKWKFKILNRQLKEQWIIERIGGALRPSLPVLWVFCRLMNSG